MELMYVLVGGMILFLLVSFTWGYFLAKNAIGEKAAKQNTLFAMIGVPFGIALVLPFILLPDSVNKFGFLHGFFFLLILGFLVTRFVRGNQFMGQEIRVLNPNQQNKILFWAGAIQFIVQPIGLFLILPSLINSGADVLEFFAKAGGALNSILFGINAVYFGNSPVKLYENEISVMGMRILWSKFIEYKFDNIPQNTLRAKYKYDIPFIPGILNLAVSASDKLVLQEVLQQKLSHLGEIRAS